MKFNPVAPHEIMEGDVYFIAHFGLPEKHYTIKAGIVAAAQSSLLLLSQRGLVFRTKDEVQAFVTDAIAPWAASIAQRTCSEDLKDETITAPEEADCAACSGTGEGQFEGQSCPICRGRGY